MNGDVRHHWYSTAVPTNCKKPEKSLMTQLLPNNADTDPGESYASAYDSTTTATRMAQPPPALPDASVLCLTGEPMYGQTFNRIITVANTLAAAAHDYPHHGPMRVGLDLEYSRWYDSFLERPELVPNQEQRYETLLFYYEGECTVKVGGELMYWKFGENAVQSQRLHTLLPKLKFRRQAEQVLQQWRAAALLAHQDTTLVTVHRRNLDGKCQSIAYNNVYSLCHGNRTSHGGSGPMITDPPRYGQLATLDQRVAVCDWDHNMILNDLKEQGNNHGQVSIMLLTDGQVPALDRTFPRIGNFSFPVEAWLMALSDVHYGNPFSTVDYVVYTWRRDVLGKDLHTMRPSTCYP
jgi:hypothetical protein